MVVLRVRIIALGILLIQELRGALVGSRGANCPFGWMDIRSKDRRTDKVIGRCRLASTSIAACKLGDRLQAALLLINKH